MAYGKVEETFWSDERIRGLTEDGRDLMLYLLTCPHRNRLGCFVLDAWYAGGDLQWETARVDAARQQLVEIGRIDWDPATRVVYLRKHWKHNVLRNQQAVKGAISELQGVPDNPFLARMLVALEEHGRAHYRGLIEAVRARVEKSSVAQAPITSRQPDVVAPPDNPVNDPVNGPLTCSDSCSEAVAVPLQLTTTSPVVEGKELQAEDVEKPEEGGGVPRVTDAELREVAIRDLGLGQYHSAIDQATVNRELQALLNVPLDRENLRAALRGCCLLRDEGLCGFEKGQPYTPGILVRWGPVWYGEGDQRTQRSLVDVAQEEARRTKTGRRTQKSRPTKPLIDDPAALLSA